MSAYYEAAEHVVLHLIAEHMSGGHKRESSPPLPSDLDLEPAPLGVAAGPQDSRREKRARAGMTSMLGL